MNKYEISQILREMGFLIELTDEFPKKGLAYQKAARTIETLDAFEEILLKRDLESLPGIGPTLSRTITQLALKGSHPYYEKLKTKVPASLLELKNVPGLGTRRIRELYQHLNVTNLIELEQAFIEGKTQGLRGYGPAFLKRMLERISSLKKEGVVLLYPQAMIIAEAIKHYFSEIEYTDHIEITGELRRKLEMCNHLEFVVITDKPENCLRKFLKFGFVKEVVKAHVLEATVLLKQGLKATVYFASKEQFPFSLIFHTGSSEHVVALQKFASKKKFTFNEFGFLMDVTHKHIKNEDDIYNTLELQYIPPEIRENTGEIAAAKKGKLPKLIEEYDLKGVFHCHTNESDGRNTLEQMAKEALRLGWEYIGISDHSKSSYQAHGLNEERLFNQLQAIHALNLSLGPSFQVFAGIECDILKDGLLDFPDEVLKKLDFVIVSVHRYFNLEEDLMTQRMIKAIENPYTTMVGHPTGRLLRLRPPYKIDMQKIIDACVANGKIIELNAFSDRLDMDWRLWQKAKEKGLKCSINPDAHSLKDLKNVRFGINMARKGWLEKTDVINTLPLKQMRTFLNKKDFQ